MSKLILPIDSHLDSILAQLEQSDNLVLVAEPGAGKTTRLPPALLTRYQNQILVLEPRRVAALAAADRIAAENNFELGKEVGYRVRFENKTSRDTRLVFMTEALLTRRLLDDSQLEGVDVVVLDEFHERSISTDLALGFLRELQELRSVGSQKSFKLIVMSATLEAEKIAAYLGEAPIVRVPGQIYPLDTQWLDKPLRPITDALFYQSLVRTVQTASTKSKGNILVFLPGVGEIFRAQDQLETWVNKSGFEIIQLHGSLNLEDQRRALQKGQRRRIILATNIAESSLTVDGIDAVVDGGLSKIMRQDLATGFSRLETARISLSSAKQRAGRAARQTNGFCFRLWTKNEEASFKKDEVAEIHRSELTETLLYLAALGVNNFEQFTWFEKPKSSAIKKAAGELRDLGAITAGGAITEYGRRLVQLPLKPIWAHFLLQCARYGQLRDGARVTALAQERDILRNDSDAAEAMSGDEIENDIAVRLQLLDERSGSRRDLNMATVRVVLQAAEKYESLVNNLKIEKGAPDSLENILLKAFAGRLCRRRGKSERALMVGGRGVKLAPSSTVRKSEFFVALQAVDFSGSADTTVSQAVGFTREQILEQLECVERDELYFDEEKGRLFAKRQLAYRDLPVEEPRLSSAPDSQSSEQLALFLAKNVDYVQKHNDGFAHTFARWSAFVENVEPDLPPWPLEDIFKMAAMGENRLDNIIKKDLTYFISSQMKPATWAQFEEMVPSHFVAPTGSRFVIHYPPERQPYVEVRLQELFGLKENPKLFGGKMHLQFHLLAPNYRPQQVTSDIASFWRNTYAEVRSELRARYPKHSWPEDPLTAVAVKKGQSHKR